MNSSYQINQTPRTTSNYVLAGILASQLLAGQGVLAPAGDARETLLDVPYSTKSALPSFDQIRSIFGSVLDQGVGQFVESVSNFYANLAARQEPLGAEFSRVLHENLWDLYER